MKPDSQLLTQVLVFSLAAAAFTTVYITQAVLPVIENEFGIDPRTLSLSVSMVIFGVALANLPFGMVADRYPKKPTILIGRTVITATSPVCAATHNIAIFIAAWFIRGLLRASEMKVIERIDLSKRGGRNDDHEITRSEGSGQKLGIS